MKLVSARGHDLGESGLGLRRCAGTVSLPRAVAELLDEVRQFGARVDDDQTLVLLRRVE